MRAAAIVAFSHGGGQCQSFNIKKMLKKKLLTTLVKTIKQILFKTCNRYRYYCDGVLQ